MMRRHRGYVIGYHNTANGPEWTVRVKDPQSQFDGQKFVVDSIKGDFELAAGLSVDFTVENFFDDPTRGKVSKATSIRAQT